MKRQCGYRKKGGVYLIVPTSDDGLSIEYFLVDPHSGQPLIWKKVRENPDGGYPVCGISGAGKSAVLWTLYRRAVLPSTRLLVGRFSVRGPKIIAFRFLIERFFRSSTSSGTITVLNRRSIDLASFFFQVGEHLLAS